LMRGRIRRLRDLGFTVGADAICCGDT
jgi:hypothetical protein